MRRERFVNILLDKLVQLVCNGIVMTDRSDEYRKAAADCLALARSTISVGTRASLLLMAQKWFDMANGPPSTGNGFDGGLQGFNDEQMSKPQPARSPERSPRGYSW